MHSTKSAVQFSISYCHWREKRFCCVCKARKRKRGLCRRKSTKRGLCRCEGGTKRIIGHERAKRLRGHESVKRLRNSHSSS